MTDSRTQSTSFRGDIQGLRAVAVGLVILAHAGVPGLGGGYVGVDVFFVISGFLITGILARAVHAGTGVSIGQFYARRARRILPAAAACLVFISLATVLVYTSARSGQVLNDVTWAAFFAANIDLATSNTGYFAEDTFVSPVQHFWSLAVEEQFYLVWPLLILGCWWLAGRARGQQPRGVYALRYAGAMVAVISVASLAWSAYQTAAEPQSAYFSTFTRAWELGIGALLALVAPRLGGLPDRLQATMSWTGLGAIALAGVAYSDATPFPGISALLPVLGSALVLAGGVEGPRTGATVVLGTRPMRWVGDLSYSLYLWHWPLLILPAAWLGHDLGLGETLLALAATVGVSWASYRWVETPVRETRLLRTPRWRALAMWPVSVVVVLATVGAAHVGVSALEGPAAASSSARAATPAQLRADVAESARAVRADADLPRPLTPALEDLRDDVTRVDDFVPDPSCSGDYDVTAVDICPLADTDSDKTVVVIGDSHMGMWLRPLVKRAQERGYRVIPFLKSRCLAVDALQRKPDGSGKAIYRTCAEFRAWTRKRVAELKPDVIVLASLWTVPIVDENGEGLAEGDAAKSLKQGAVRNLNFYLGTGARVHVLGPLPLLDEEAADCLGSTASTMATCTGDYERVAQRVSALREAAQQTKARFTDLTPWFCDRERTCPLVVGGRIVYRDTNHVTTTYAERLGPVLTRAIPLR